MALEMSIMLIKPDAVEHEEEIRALLHQADLKILDYLRLPEGMSRELAEAFYVGIQRMPYFGSQCAFMGSGSVIAFKVMGEDAIRRLRELLGATNPANASPGTIRALYGNAGLYAQGTPANAAHASDSPENAAREAELIFSSH